MNNEDPSFMLISITFIKRTCLKFLEPYHAHLPQIKVHSVLPH